MNTNKYRELLAAFSEQISSIDAQAGRLTERWLTAFDLLSSSPPARFPLADHLSRVSRGVTAIEILALEKGSHPPPIGAREVLGSTANDLRSETTSLLQQIRQINAILADRGLGNIVGEELCSVEFVMDYVRFVFSDCALTAYVSPRVEDRDRTWSEDDQGYRDALCALIAMVVKSIEVIEEEVLRITFTDGRALAVSLRPEDAVGPECAYFTSGTGLWWVW